MRMGAANGGPTPAIKSLKMGLPAAATATTAVVMAVALATTLVLICSMDAVVGMYGTGTSTSAAPLKKKPIQKLGLNLNARQALCQNCSYKLELKRNPTRRWRFHSSSVEEGTTLCKFKNIDTIFESRKYAYSTYLHNPYIIYRYSTYLYIMYGLRVVGDPWGLTYVRRTGRNNGIDSYFFIPVSELEL